MFEHRSDQTLERAERLRLTTFTSEREPAILTVERGALRSCCLAVRAKLELVARERRPRAPRALDPLVHADLTRIHASSLPQRRSLGPGIGPREAPRYERRVGCPDDAKAMRFIEGNLEHGEHRDLLAHLDTCPRCYSLMTELGRVFASDIRRSVISPYAETVALTAVGAGSSLRPAPMARRASASLAEAEVGAGGLTLGTRLGRYLVERTLGQGGMGTVVQAFDEVLDRSVALKLLHVASLQGSDAEAFVLAEARAASQINHPNVVSIYDAGALEGPPRQLFISMELVSGENLRQWLNREPRSQAAIVDVITQAAHGLSAMHQRSLVHRDLKPENILVGEDGRVRVTDFGLVQKGASKAGALVGTPAYMSPEQLFMRPTTASTDQFSLAVVLWEALVGARPFQGRNLDELRWAMTSNTTGPNRLPSELANVCRTALAMDPGMRFPSVAHFASALGRAARPKENVHVTLNTYFSVVMTLVHVGLFISFFNVLDDPRPPSPPSSSSSPEDNSIFMNVGVAMFLIGLLVSAVWIPLGVFWAPLNAYGLRKGHGWARVSTMVYGALAIPTCIGTPYGIYALMSLGRRDVRARFASADD